MIKAVTPPERGLFRFRRADSIGTADADDDPYLETCFVDSSGIVEALILTENAMRIIVGRTGSGKTALIKRIGETQSHTININPETLSVTYVTNSTILKFLASLNVNLDIFYTLLWRHVFAVEIIKHKFNIYTKIPKDSIFQRIASIVRSEKHKRALTYLQQWGESFWLETDFRIKEITTKMEDELKCGLSAVIPVGSMDVGYINKLSEEIKGEIAHRAQEIISKVQIRELSEVMSLLDEILDDPQDRYFITIDKLDERWVDDRLRYSLIRALIETIRDFRVVHNAKLIVSLRWDLLDRVYRHTRDSGFQEEKYESLYCVIKWTRTDLIDVINSRVAQLVASRYTSKIIGFGDVFPLRMKKENTLDFIVDRTLMRPRDAIMFINFCISHAEGKTMISEKIISDAEADYSRDRLRSIADEWYSDYPNLLNFHAILKERPDHFRLGDVTEMELDKLLFEFMGLSTPKKDCIEEMAFKAIDGTISKDFFKNELFST